MAIKQILSNETPNDKGFVVTNNSIDWSRYSKNPVLLRNQYSGGHNGAPVGRVENIRLESGAWTGELTFGSSELAQAAKKDYDDGILNGVSISGLARIVERDNGKRFTTNFLVYEISLVNFPSNPDAVAVRGGNTALSSVIFNAVETEQVESLSSRDIEIINQIECVTMNEENIKPDTTQAPGEEKISLSAFERIAKVFGISPKPIMTELQSTKDQQEEVQAGDQQEGLATDRVSVEEGEEEQNLSSQVKKDEVTEDSTESLESEATGRPEEQESLESKPEVPPTSLSTGAEARVFDVTKSQKTINMKVQPFYKYVTDKANEHKLARIVALSSHTGNDTGITEVALSSGDGENSDRAAIYELAASMVADKRFMAVVKNVTFQVNEGRAINATDTIQALASGSGSGQFVQNADLAKIVWLSLFVRQLFPDDSWASRVRRLSVSDREGVIWAESAVNPEIYFGDRAPLEAKNHMYDDAPRGLERKVFSMQPILWQTANTDILNYNDVATGMADSMAKLTSSIHNYWLQIIAEAVPSANYIPMTGEEFSADGRFVINPAAAGNLRGLHINDLITAQGRFLSRNLQFSLGSGVAVFSEPFFTSFMQNPVVQSALTLQLSGTRPEKLVYSGFEVITRAFLAGFDTASNSVVDAERYFDKPVDFATGAIDDTHTKPVLGTTVYDTGLGFMPEEIIVGVGKTNIHMVSDPNNYGWKMSADMSTGAGTLRSSAAGICLFVPTPVTP